MSSVSIVLLFKSAQFKVDIELEEDISTFRVQVWTLTDVPPEEQCITGLGPGVLRDSDDLKSLGIQPGTWVMLDRRPPPAAPPPPPQPAGLTIAQELEAQRAQAEMQSRIGGGFQTAAQHDDPALQRKALALIPWVRLCEAARAKRAGAVGTVGREAADTVGPEATTASATGSAALVAMRASPELVRVAEAARRDPAQLGPLLHALAAKDAAALELVRANQEDFRTFVSQPAAVAAVAPPPPLPPPPVAPDEPELKELLRWFKHEFFKWVNSPECEVTGEATQAIGMGEPTAAERAWGAGRVELYRGPSGHVTRFPRYNHPAKLLETRRGRCGEWANCFTLMCRAVGFEARWVLDVTDHVWTEVYSPTREVWIHADPCENVCDAPLLYEKGWGKKLSYVFAFRSTECVDVTRRYSASWDQSLARRHAVAEGWLSLFIASVNDARQASMPAPQRAALAERGRAECEQLAALDAERKAAAESVLTAAERRGRQTGSVEWRRQRGELGSEQQPASAPTKAAPVRRVCGAVGSVVHGLMLEGGESGARQGAFLENSQERMQLRDEAGVLRRGGRWEALEPEEHITRLQGYGSSIGYLCATVTLTLSSGRQITFKGQDAESTSTEAFDFTVPDGAELSDLTFGDATLLSIGVVDAPSATKQCTSHVEAEAEAGAEAVAEADSTAALTAAVRSLQLDGQRGKTALTIARKLVGNVMAKPTEPSVRRLRLANETLKSKLYAAPAVLELLPALGFVTVEGADGDVAYVLGEGASLEPLQRATKLFDAALDVALEQPSSSASCHDFSGHVMQVGTREEFEAVLAAAASRGQAVVVDFTATWCGPCQMIAPAYKALAADFLRVVFLKVDVDENQEVAQLCGVQAMPTFQVYKNQVVVGTLRGANEAGLRALVQQHV